MSVIVKGMKMPDCCAVCKFLTYDDWATSHEYECTALSEFMDDDELPEGRRNDCPLVDEEPVKRGMWTFISLTDKDGYKAKECSSCGSTFFDTKQWNYCPNCGADMRGEE